MPNPGKEILTSLYHQKDRRLQEIADEYSVTREAVRLWMEKEGIPRIRNRKHRRRPQSYQSLDQYFEYVQRTGKENLLYLRKSLILLFKHCQECPSIKYLNTHHLKYPATHITHVQLLCCSCHHCKHRKGNGYKIQLEICDKYVKGTVGSRLATEFNVTPSMIYYILRKWNVERRKGIESRENSDAINSRNKEISFRCIQGQSVTNLAIAFNLRPSTIYNILRKQNIFQKTKGAV